MRPVFHVLYLRVDPDGSNWWDFKVVTCGSRGENQSIHYSRMHHGACLHHIPPLIFKGSHSHRVYKGDPSVGWSLISSVLLGTSNAVVSPADGSGPGGHGGACGRWPAAHAAAGRKCGGSLGMLSLGPPLLLLIRDEGKRPTGSITTPPPKLLKPWVFIQRVVK